MKSFKLLTFDSIILIPVLIFKFYLNVTCETMSDDCSSIATDITAFSDEDDFSNSSSSFGKYKMVYKVNGMNQEDMECKIENVSMLTCTCINSDYFYIKILFYHKFPCAIILLYF